MSPRQSQLALEVQKLYEALQKNPGSSRTREAYQHALRLYRLAQQGVGQ